MKIAWFDCFSGISGDMTLGALIGAGWERSALASLPQRLGLAGVSIDIETVRRGAFSACKVDVRVEEAKQPHRHLKHVVAMIDAGRIAPEVKAGARAVFERLAAAEAEVHGSTIEKVHFHEVGAADALVDVVGAIEGLHALGVERVHANPPLLGRGTVMSQHGRIPVPAPATALLLRGAPVIPGGIEAEMTTPTGAALLATLVRDWSAPPEFRLGAIGVGAGSRDLKEQANVLRVILGETGAAGLRRGRVAVLETALDDENPQHLGALIPRLLEHGALDAMLVPNLMKKGRPGTWLIVIAKTDAAEALAKLVLRETSSLGVRVREEDRIELPREAVEVETRFGRVALKVATLPDGTRRAAPEFESLRDAAARADRPLREVADAALAAWRLQSGGD